MIQFSLYIGTIYDATLKIEEGFKFRKAPCLLTLRANKSVVLVHIQPNLLNSKACIFDVMGVHECLWN